MAAGVNTTVSLPNTPVTVLLGFRLAAVVPLYARVMAPAVFTLNGAGVITRLALVTVKA